MKTITILFIVLITAYCFPQENVLLGKHNKANVSNLQEVHRIKSPLNTSTTQVLKPINIANEIGVIDTLSYFDPFSYKIGFGLFGQDWLIQWFRAPASLWIKGLGFYCDDNPNNTPAEVKIVKVNWTEAQLISADTLQRGFYEALGNGYNDITSFLDNPDRTGDWTSIQSGDTEPFEHDIWSNNGVGYSFIPDETLKDFQWIDMNVLGDEPYLNDGEIFGVALKNTSANLDGDGIFFSAGIAGYPGWKFYANGRWIPGVDYGWWTKEYTFDFRVAVDIISGGFIYFNSITYLNSTLSTESREVFANIIASGVPSNIPLISKIYYSTDQGTSWNSNDMEYLGNFDYRGTIPGFPLNTNVKYYLEATDTSHGSSHTVDSPTFSYTIFGPSPGVKTLLVFNGYTRPNGFPQDSYFGSGEWPANYSTLNFDHDIWAYGPLTSELLNHYWNVLEICTNGPIDINSDTIRTWLEADFVNSYMLAGDEWLGAQSNWTDGPHSAGDFIFDILGINYEYNDINYATSGDQLLPSIVYPQQGSLLGGSIFDMYNYVSYDSSWTAPMTYDPYYQIGVDNWLDGVDFESDVVVDMMGKPKTGPNKVIGGHRTLPAGNKIAFFAYDPLSLNSDTENEVEYFWYGFMDSAPHARPLLGWFTLVWPDDVNDGNGQTPDNFNLAQNYPNPFNPVTTIRYSIPTSPFNPSPYQGEGQRERLVRLKVYDILGTEVATLVNKEQNPGSYSIDFNASHLASGIYFYRLQAGSFIDTKKMILLK